MRERPGWTSVLVAATAACLLSACGGGQSEAGSAGTTTTAGETGDVAPPTQRCRGGPTRPLDLETVIETVRRHGITLYADPACQPDPTIVTQAANVLLYGPNANVDREREITQAEGAVTCMLRHDAGPAAPKTVERVQYPGDEETHFKLLNVDCVIYPEPDKAEEQRTRLEAAMDDLREQAKTNA